MTYLNPILIVHYHNINYFIRHHHFLISEISNIFITEEVAVHVFMIVNIDSTASHLTSTITINFSNVNYVSA